MSNANEVLLLYKEEAAYGVEEAADTDWLQLRFTGESLQLESNNIQSAEIVNTRQVADLVRVSARAAGDVNGELSSRTYDDMIEAAMYGTWASTGTDTTTATFTTTGVSGREITVTASAEDPFATALGGQYFQLRNMAEAANNQVFRIKSKTSNTEVVAMGMEAAPVNSGGPSSGSGDCRLFDKLANGTLERSFTLQRVHDDLGAVTETYLGLIPDGMTLGVSVDNIVTIGFSFIGSNQVNDSAVKDASPDLTTTQVLNTVDHVLGVVSSPDYTTTAAFQVTGLNMQSSNNLAERRVVGQFAAHSIRAGVFQVTGGVTALFEDNTLSDVYLAGSVRNIAILFRDDQNGDTLVFDFLSTRMSQASSVAGGQNQDVILDIQFQAIKDAVLGTTLQIHRWQAP